MRMKISKIILVIILFVVFFEIGLFSSYTIVNSEIPDIGELITMQTDFIGSIFSAENVGTFLVKDPAAINISNKIDVAEKLSNEANIDGVDIDGLNVTTTDDAKKGGNISVNISALGFSAPSNTSGQIVISGEPDYKVSATATASLTDSGYRIDVNSIKVTSILKMYDGSNSSKNNYSNYYTKGSSSTYKKYSSSSKYSSGSGGSSSGSSGSGGSSDGSSGSGNSSN